MRTSTIFSPAGLRILCEPYLVGDELFELAIEAGRDMLRYLQRGGGGGGGGPSSPEADLITQPQAVTILQILNGGRYYALEKSYEREFLGGQDGGAVKIVSLQAKRYQEMNTGAWNVRIWNQQGDIPDSGLLLIGDTVATGATLAGVISSLMDTAEKNQSRLPKIVVFTIAGAKEALERLKPVDARLRERFNEELHIIYANAQLKLNGNGTDLEFVKDIHSAQPEFVNEFHPQAIEMLHRVEGFVAFAPRMKCAIWDWGDRFREIEKHMKEVHEYYTHQPGCPRYILEGIAARMHHISPHN